MASMTGEWAIENEPATVWDKTSGVKLERCLSQIIYESNRETEILIDCPIPSRKNAEERPLIDINPQKIRVFGVSWSPLGPGLRISLNEGAITLIEPEGFEPRNTKGIKDFDDLQRVYRSEEIEICFHTTDPVVYDSLISIRNAFREYRGFRVKSDRCRIEDLDEVRGSVQVNDGLGSPTGPSGRLDPRTATNRLRAGRSPPATTEDASSNGGGDDGRDDGGDGDSDDGGDASGGSGGSGESADGSDDSRDEIWDREKRLGDSWKEQQKLAREFDENCTEMMKAEVTRRVRERVAELEEIGRRVSRKQCEREAKAAVRREMDEVEEVVRRTGRMRLS